jgi:uncharacterized protein (AIM24 family)
MKTKTVIAAILAALVAGLVPAFASADSGAVQSDLAQLSTDVKAAHDAFVKDFGDITAAAQNGDKAGVKTAVGNLRTDRRALLPAVRKDRHQLRVDLKAAKAAGVTGLADTVKASVSGNRALIKEVRQAGKQALQALRALRGSSATS